MNGFNQLGQLCALFGDFDLARAVVDLEENSFVTWNRKFLELTGYSEEELRVLMPANLIVFDQTASSPDKQAHHVPEFGPCNYSVPWRNTSGVGAYCH